MAYFSPNAEQMEEVRKLAHQYFQERGIPADVADHLTTPLTARQTAALTGFAVPSIQFHYYELSRERIEGFTRVRFLRVGGGGQPTFRYWQPRGSRPRLYIPPLCDWPEIARDTGRPIAITEGEAKAIALTLAGIPTLGLGGVWNFEVRNDE